MYIDIDKPVKFYGYAYESFNRTCYDVDFPEKEVDDFSFVQRKCYQLKTPQVSIEISGNLSDDFDLIELLTWLRNKNLITDKDANEIAETRNSIYYDEDEAILEALEGNAAYEAGLLDKIKNAIKDKVQQAAGARAAKQIKNSQRTQTDPGLERLYDRNINKIKEDIKSNQESPSKAVMQPSDIARYYAIHWAQNQDIKLYALTNENARRNNYVDVSVGISDLDEARRNQIIDYYRTGDEGKRLPAGTQLQNDFKVALSLFAKVILSNISKAENGGKRTVVGYTLDEAFAQQWKNFVPGSAASSISDEDAKNKWDELSNTEKQSYLNKKLAFIRSESRTMIIEYIMRYGSPFKDGLTNILFRVVLGSRDGVGLPAAQALTEKTAILSKIKETGATKGFNLAGEHGLDQLKIIAGCIRIEKQLGLDFTSKFYSDGEWMDYQQMGALANSSAVDATLEYEGEQINFSRAYDIVREQGGDRGGLDSPQQQNERKKYVNSFVTDLKGLSADQLVTTVEIALRNKGYAKLTDSEKTTLLEGNKLS